MHRIEGLDPTRSRMANRRVTNLAVPWAMTWSQTSDRILSSPGPRKRTEEEVKDTGKSESAKTLQLDLQRCTRPLHKLHTLRVLSGSEIPRGRFSGVPAPQGEILCSCP